jgi:exopolysaccharide biosynthesis polyprenyl glycosylphosphotransferase
MLAAVPFIVAFNKASGLYDRDELVLSKTTLDEFPRLIQNAGLFTLTTWLLHDHVTSSSFEVRQVVLMWGITIALLFVTRCAARKLAASTSGPERCLVAGEPSVAERIVTKLRLSAGNFDVVARLPLHAGAPTPDPTDYRRRLREYRVQRLVIAPVSTDTVETLDLIRLTKSLGVRVSVIPRLFEVVGSAVEFDHLDGLTVLGVRRFGLTRSSRLAKRVFDLVGATIALIAMTPVMAAIAVAVQLEGKGPIFFRQARAGRDGVPFEMIKFRSMVPDADALKANLRHLNEARSGLFKIAHDPRVTRVGRFCRKTSLDELPQLFNVFRGQMSLVGPRPLVLDEDVYVEGYDRARLHLTPGMTGHWQILGSARLPMDEMLGIDYLYVANWSLWSDVKILLRTVPYVLSRRGM